MCNTDLNLVCMKLRMKKPYRRRHECRREKKRFDVSLLDVSQLRFDDNTDTGSEVEDTH